MKHYKIIVSGRGFDCKVFPLSDDQIDQFSDIADEFEDYLEEETIELINDITGLNFNENTIDYFDSDKSIFGPNDAEGDYSVSVYDEDDKLVYTTPNNWLQIQNEEEENELVDEYWENNKLLMAQYCKADFYEYNLEVTDTFNPSLLKGYVTLVAETFSLLTDLYYDEKKLDYADVFQDVTYSSYYGQLMVGG